MAEDLYPRPIELTKYPAFANGTTYPLDFIVRPAVANNHIYIVTVAGTAGGTPTWPTASQATTTTGGVTFAEHGLAPGVQYLHYTKHAKNWTEISLISTYEDKGFDVNESADDALQRWTLEYDGLSEADAKILDDFWDNHRRSQPFTFIEPRDYPWTYGEGELFAGVYFEDYQKPNTVQYHVQARVVRLVQNIP